MNDKVKLKKRKLLQTEEWIIPPPPINIPKTTKLYTLYWKQNIL